MKVILQIIFVSLCISSVAEAQQYYLKGEVRDEKGNALQNVSIVQQRTGYVFRSGSMGSFGILSNRSTDTLIFSMDGYFKETVLAKSDIFEKVQLKLAPVVTTVKRDKLASLTLDLERREQRDWFVGDETYASLVENNFINANRYPSTDLALNIDKASYSNIRRFITMKTSVPPDAVRIEEMLNYFNFGYEEPADNALFSVKSTLTTCPWNKDGHLFFVNIDSKRLNLDSLPPTHLVFLVDISGSMDMPNRLPLLKSAFHLLTTNLRVKDTVSIVVYGATVGILLPPTSGSEKDSINKAIDDMQPGGSTPGESGIRMAYAIARNHFIEGGNNRVILATDGDFNVGLKTEEELDELITRNRQSGIYLTCLGVGMGNYKDSKIQTLARKGNGNFAYIDNYQEAEKVLMKEYTQTLYAVADDVYMNVRFNRNIVSRYRVIGFDNKVGAIADSLSIIEGGEIGSGHSMIAAFEIEMAKSKTEIPSDSLFARIQLDFRYPNDTVSRNSVFECRYRPLEFRETAPSIRFSTAVIIYGSLLRESPYIKNMHWDDVLYYAGGSANKEDVNQLKFIELVQATKTLYNSFKKKKRRKKDEELY